MECNVNGVSVHYVEYGDGTPILMMHGSGVDHREMVGTMEPIFGDIPDYRRIYLDLPGMGRTPAPETINSSDDVVELVLGLVDMVIGDRDLLVIGHSAGGYFARAVANRRRDQVIGLAVSCPLIENPRDITAHQVVHAAGDLGDVLSPDDRTEFEGYFVVHTPAMQERFQHYVAPAIPLADQGAMARIGERWRLSPGPEDGPPYPNPTLIITGRQDSSMGFAGHWDLVEHYPRATFAVLDRAGHALPHEQGDLVEALITEWLRRVQEHRSA
ncbi:alpha/beta hydrolase [Nocardia vinacea]|uniref:alpha/beta fold hydrolase n=1 Tax=Nocardia vinacea TaxID=96468 RepID=UPI003443E5C7